MLCKKLEWREFEIPKKEILGTRLNKPILKSNFDLLNVIVVKSITGSEVDLLALKIDVQSRGTTRKKCRGSKCDI